MRKIYSLFLALFFSASVFAAGHIVTATGLNVTCNGACDGSITTSLSGGVGPFTYLWSPSSATTPSVTGLCPGSYTVTCTDNSDMSTATASVTITQPTLLTATLSGATICAGSCATLSPIVSGGTPPYNYSWSGGLFGPSPSACPASTITYTLTVTDGNACVAIVTAVVTMATPLVTVNSPTICAGATANLTAAGATSYAWSAGATPTGIATATASPSVTTTYTVTGTTSGCTGTAIATVTVNSPAVTVNSPAICTGGIANLTAAGATSYAWSAGTTPTGVNTATASPSVTTTYTVTGTASGCTGTAISTVTVNPVPTITLSPAYTTCMTGCVVMSASATGTPAYSWTGPFGYTATTALATVCPPAPSTYTYTVVATSAGCTASATTAVTVNPLPTVTLPPSYTVCYGNCATMTATTSGASIYSWSPSASLSSASIPNPIACPVASLNYTLTVTSSSGCTANASTALYVDGPIISNISSTNTTGCATCDGGGAVSPTGGSSPYTYNWSTGLNSPAVNFICPGTYSVTITDAAGCTTTDSTTVFANNSTIANFTMVPDSTNAYNFFAFNSSTGTGNSYAWDFGDGVTSTLGSPTHTYSAIGTYTVCVIASNFLCGADTLCRTVNVTGTLASCLALFNIADDTLNPDPNAHYVYNLSYGATLSYLWDFGDGTTSTSMTPSHVYAGTGPYLLCLSVDNGAGCIDMYCDSLISADSLNRSSGIMQLTVYDVPTFYSIATGVANTIETGNITVAPNPFNETTVFTVKTNEIYTFELTDVLGKKVKSKTGISEKQFEISREDLQNGIYFYKVYTAESVVGIGKVVIK